MYKLICLDLDGTLLSSKKELSNRNKNALKEASLLGIQIVACTGRFYKALPEVIKELDFTNYAIIINGSQILDLKENKIIYDASLSLETALSIMKNLDNYDVLYDCYLDGEAYMTASQYNLIDEYIEDKYYSEIWKKNRLPVEELKSFISEKNRPIQKIQFVFKNSNDKKYYMDFLSHKFPNAKITSSMPNNVEINDINANKGIAIKKLAEHIGCSINEVIGIGDGFNDYEMIKTAGLGIAMKNACFEILEIADDVTDDNDHDGVAKAIEKYCLK